MSTERYTIVVDERGSRRVTKNIGAIGVASKSSNKSVKLLQKNLLALGGGLTLLAGISTIASFGQEMATIQAITGATTVEFDALRASARKLGAETQFSATQSAQGMKFLSRAGFDTKEVLESIEPVLQLAQAGTMDLGRAADITSNVLKGFRLENSETAMVVDILAKASNSANTDIEQLGQALSFVAPIAAGLGVTLAETSAAIGALSDAGIQASRAGTGLMRIMSELESPSEKTLELFEAIGINQEDVKISTVGLTQALEELVKAAIDTGGGLEVFGQRGGPAFEVLSSGIGDVKRLHEAMKNATGTGAEMARIMDDTLLGAAKRLLSAFSELALSIADLGFEDLAKSGLDNMAVAIRNLAKAVRALMRILVILTPIIIFAFGVQIKLAVIALAVAIRTYLISAFETLYLLILYNPVGAFMAVIVALIATIVIFRDKIDLMGDGVSTLGDLMTVTAEDMVEGWRIMGRELDIFSDNKLNNTIDKVDDMSVSIGEWMRQFAQGLDIVTGAMAYGLTYIALWLESVFLKFASYGDKIKNAIRRTFGLEEIPSAIGRAAEMAGVALEEHIAKGVEMGTAFDDMIVAKLVKAEKKGRDRLKSQVGSPDKSTNPNPAGDGLDKALEAATKLKADFRELENSLLPAVNAQRQLATTTDLVTRAVKAGLIHWSEGVRLINAQKENTKELLEPYGTMIDQLEDQHKLLGFTNDELAVETQMLQIKNELISQQIPIDEEKLEIIRQSLFTQIELNKANQVEGALIRELLDPQENYIRNMKVINKLKEEGILLGRDLAITIRNEKIALLQTQNTLQSGAKQAWLEYQNQVDDVAGNMKNAMTNAFQGMEDALVNFVQTGKLEFTDLANSIIEDMIRMMIQKSITGPLMGLFPFAQGGVVTPFASGGVVDSPTYFPMSSGTGLMGEAGTEGIFPLTQMPNGDLGVQGMGGGGGDVNNSVYVTVESNEGDDPAETGQVIGDMVNSMLDIKMAQWNTKARRPGGVNNRGMNF